jgi:hypothetical protein
MPGQVYSLTGRGRTLLAEAPPVWDRAQDRLRAALGEAGWRALMRLADRTSAAAQSA